MTDIEMLEALVDNPGAPGAAKMAYKAGYLEGFLLTLMDRYPEVRKGVETCIHERKY